jgi:Fe-S-cluster-containing dehydrogenase component
MSLHRLDIEEALCWGCKTCEVACKQENGAPTGVKLIEIEEWGPRLAEEGQLEFSFRVSRCRHCEDAPCAEACAEGAIDTRADGIVVLDQSGCTACLACIDACPYQAISFDDQRGVAAKCNLCHHRIDQGLLPACADNVCLAHCIHLAGVLVVNEAAREGAGIGRES